MRYLIKKTILLPPTVILKQIENTLLRRDRELKYAPVFIIGNPRSGSTLLYQVITRHFETCYFTNIMNLFPESPVSIAKLVASANGCNPPHSFNSRYGHTAGWNAPNQGVRIWNRWFPNNWGFVGPEALSERAIHEIRNTIALIQQSFDVPFISKWQPLSERILAIADALPEALFIRIKRNPAFIAQSILRSRRILWNDETRWFSTKPRDYEEIKYLKYLEQICEQVLSIEKDIDSDSEIIGKNRFMTVHYEELCKSPRIIMIRINDFYMKHLKYGPLKVRNEIPLTFPCDNSLKITAEEFQSINACLSDSQTSIKNDTYQ